MTKKVKVEVFQWDDWVKLVIDGNSYGEGHSITTYDLCEIFCELAGYDFEYTWLEDED